MLPAGLWRFLIAILKEAILQTTAWVSCGNRSGQTGDESKGDQKLRFCSIPKSIAVQCPWVKIQFRKFPVKYDLRGEKWGTGVIQHITGSPILRSVVMWQVTYLLFLYGFPVELILEEDWCYFLCHREPNTTLSDFVHVICRLSLFVMIPVLPVDRVQMQYLSVADPVRKNTTNFKQLFN